MTFNMPLIIDFLIDFLIEVFQLYMAHIRRFKCQICPLDLEPFEGLL